ncbi:adhesion G protein-coupled receptor E5 isoform X3 [Myotis myotis]|uniref:adhesion G protein-coupled receptor E5 isoform X3 n=1 Tax=Myotis myotis TaxID=51298 RepID=UPI00174C3A58|nr:adhesion G protein-coupled receptor E5 isoform X3 [Myotis myotis]
MEGPRLSAFHILQALCVLLILLEDGPQSTRASACRRPCPENSSCVNGTACLCDRGFKSSSGKLILQHEETCEDIDECEQGKPGTLCGKVAECHNTVGSYYCTCIPGYRLVSEAAKFSDAKENTCQDVNECTSGKHSCHKSTQCHNTEGSYECRCRPGWKPVPGSPNGPNNTVCEAEISFPTWTPPPGIKSQSLSNFFEKVQELSRDFTSASAQDTIQKFITSLDELEVPGDLEALALSDRYRMATHLLSYLEEVLRNLAKTLPGPSFTYRSPLDTELSLMIQEQRNGTVTLGQSHARMKLNWTQAAGVGDSGRTVAGIFSSRKMETLLVNASVELDPEKKIELEDTHESYVNKAQAKILSTVNTVFLSNKNTEKLDPPVTFSFSYHPETPKSRQELICAFWKGNDSGGSWSTTGCKKLGSSNNSITCQCSHLSSFAILMAHYDVEDLKLALITKVGLALSLVCLLLCILTFLLVRPIQGSRTTVHLHLCICLFLGSAIFLAGIENEGGQVGLRCRLVAGLLHYCFLAAFCWMSLEGLELYFLVVRVFQGQGLSKRWLYLIGYGVPFLIVAISAAARPEGYGRGIYCWLDRRHGFLWSFLGPVTFIILCNAVIFVITVWKLTQKFSEINPDMKKLKKARVLTITAIAQLLVLGCTWVFGLFLFDPRSQVLAYAFTILNCLQGFFLFLLHCLLNKKVREEYRKWACMVTGNKYSDFGTSTSSTSQNQTRSLRPSESGM